MRSEYKQISKFLSLILRHDPGKIALQLDDNGWADVDKLLTKINRYEPKLTFNLLEEVVSTNDKKRFAFNEDKTKIRASQGHSVKIDLNYTSVEPPEYLYHGTVDKFLDQIKEKGLLKMSRHHVHLSEDIETATKVATRRGKPIILKVCSGEMFTNGVEFFKSENGVWLTDAVAPDYIEFKTN